VAKPFVANTSAQLAAISSPGRDEIVDAVCSIGPCSVAELAQFLGRSRNGLYYHVRALHSCGIFLESYRTSGKRITTCYAVPGRPMLVRFDLGTTRSRAAVLRLVGARLRGAMRTFKRACHPDLAIVEGIRRNLWGSRWKGWLSDSELQEVNRIFARLTSMFRKEPGPARAGRKYYELTFVLSPTVPQPPNVTSRVGKDPLTSQGRSKQT
jgi:biotin operon repressor